MAASTSCCTQAFLAQQRHEHASSNFGSSPSSLRLQKYRGRANTSRRVCVVAVLPLPLYSLANQIPSDFEFTSLYDDWMPDEKLVKNIYLCFSLFFVWGCCVYGSMKDPFHDSDVYRDAGGDGSGNWVYKLEEEEEMQAREELWREELAREMEERVEELRELEEGQKEKELV